MDLEDEVEQQQRPEGGRGWDRGNNYELGQLENDLANTKAELRKKEKDFEKLEELLGKKEEEFSIQEKDLKGQRKEYEALEGSCCWCRVVRCYHMCRQS